jgi:genome maintenance exonuclease 1
MTGRSYKIDGERLPSVTTIISQTLPNPGIALWKARVGEDEARRVSKEATDWGTGIHALVEAVNRGNRQNLTGDEMLLVYPYTTWFDANVDLVIGAEKLLVSRQHGYAGTTDAIAVMQGDRYPAILDFKTSKTALGAEEWRLQLAAYVIAAEEHLGLVCRRRIIVRLSRTEPDTLHVHELPEDELDDDKQVFLSLLRVFKWQQAAGSIHTPKSNSIGRITFGRKS